MTIPAERCPACGGAAWRPLSGLPEQKVQQLIIVARDREHLYEHLKRAFAGNETVRVVLDRRVMGRGDRPEPAEAERRQDRPLTIDGFLRAVGWVIVPLSVPEPHRGPVR